MGRKVVGTVLGALLGGVLYGFGSEYGPAFSDPPEQRSIGGALVKAGFFSLFMTGSWLIRELVQRRGGVLKDLPTSRYERGIM
jgi:hypothetical protein